ncbi:MAG: HAMP domain-containing protein [Rhodospirillaceae bacterium]|nr:HAMP domain-containing protein [Rhodospirillaceae bacterium]
MVRFKQFLPRSIFGRSLLIVLTPMIILQVVLAIVFYERHWETVTRHLTNAVAGDISTLIWMMNSYAAEDEGSLVFRIGRIHLGVEARFHPDAKLPDPLPEAGSSRVDRLLGQGLDQRVRRPFVIDTEAPDDTALISVELQDGVLDVYVPMRRMESRTTEIFVFWMIGTSLVLSAIAAYFVRQQIRPIRRLATAADDFGKGIVDTEFKPSGAREVRQAAQAFVSMREHIQRQIEQRTLMLAGVSHDLRTPLTRMKLELALLKDSEGSKSLKSDIEDMEHMIEVYLAFARGEGQEQAQTIDLAPILRDVAHDASQDVEVSINGDLGLMGRPNALKRCLTNLVDNACRYGYTIEIVADRAEIGPGQFLTIMIDDDGPGIEEDQHEEAFQPFVRLDSSRDPNRGGGGLGLTIARDIARSHGGDLILDASPAGGLRARIILPV